MAENRAVWGIEIGQYALKALKLRYNDASEQVVALAFDYVPYPKILSQPDAIPEELIPQALETFVSRNDVQGDLIAISVPGHSALVRFIQLPPVEASKVGEIVKYEARQQIPFALDEVIWDYQPLGTGVQESGYMLDAEVGLFAMKRDQVMHQLRHFNRAKLEVELIQIAPLALYNVLCHDELGIKPGREGAGVDEHVIVLDMGCDNTTLLVSNGAKIWVRNVPVGGNHFTRALAKDMKLSFAKAEHLKCNATKSPDPRAVFQALRPVFNDYVSEIQRSIGFFSSVNRQANISKVVGYGNGFKLAGLQKFLQQNLQYNVERPDTFRRLGGDAVQNTPLFHENLLGFAVPYGLALQTLGLSRIHTSLLPPEIATAREVRRKKPWAVAAAAALLTGVTLSMIGNGVTYSSVHSQPWQEAVDEATEFGTDISNWQSAYDEQIAEFNRIREEAENLVQGRRDFLWLEVYRAINECLPRERGDAQDITDIEKRNRISIDQITTMHMADVGQWFNMLTDTDKENMSQWDRDHPPSGEGYLFILQGRHYHDDEEDPEKQALNYLVNAFLKSETGLQQWTIEAEDGNQQDVGRLGISHARAYQIDWLEIPYDPKGPDSLMARLDDRRAELYYTPYSQYGAGRNRLGGAGGQFGRSGFGRGARPGMGAGMGGIPPEMAGEFGNYGNFAQTRGLQPGGRQFGGMQRGGMQRGSMQRGSMQRGGMQRGAPQGRGAYSQGYGARDPRTGLPLYDETDDSIQWIYETQFLVEFLWKRTPEEDRFATQEEAAAATPEPAEDEAALDPYGEMGGGFEDYYGM